MFTLSHFNLIPTNFACCVRSLLSLILFNLTLIIALSTSSSSAGEVRPNIILLLADDLGYGDLGCYGNKNINTPVLDHLASQGVKLTHHYANGPECTPTRVALLTGKYQQWVGGLECAIGTGNVGRYDDAIRLREQDDLGLPNNRSTLIGHLKNAGYRTAIFGKWHLGYEPKFNPQRHGFDETFYCIGGGMDYFHYLDNRAGYNLFRDGYPVSGEGYFTDMITDRAIDFLKRQTKNQPFFLYVPYTCPHFPFQGPNDRQKDPLPLDSPLWVQNSAPPEVYRAMIEHMDRRIGDLLATLNEADEIRTETLVIFASDNGGSRSARNDPHRGIKGETYEGGIRVPAILHWPGQLPEGKVSTQPSLTFDFSASIAKLAGLDANARSHYEGIDIVSHLREGKPDQTRTLFWRKPRGETVWMGVRDGSWKLVAQKNGDSSNIELFNLEKDPRESIDLASEHPQVLERLWSLYQEWEQRTRANRRGQSVN